MFDIPYGKHGQALVVTRPWVAEKSVPGSHHWVVSRVLDARAS